MTAKDSELDQINTKLEELSGTLEQVSIRLAEMEGKPKVADRVGAQTRHAFDSMADFIEEHPVRATVIAFLLGALLFRGRH